MSVTVTFRCFYADGSTLDVVGTTPAEARKAALIQREGIITKCKVLRVAE